MDRLAAQLVIMGIAFSTTGSFEASKAAAVRIRQVSTSDPRAAQTGAHLVLHPISRSASTLILASSIKLTSAQLPATRKKRAPHNGALKVACTFGTWAARSGRRARETQPLPQARGVQRAPAFYILYADSPDTLIEPFALFLFVDSDTDDHLHDQERDVRHDRRKHNRGQYCLELNPYLRADARKSAGSPHLLVT